MDDSTDPPEVLERARGPRRYSAKYKAKILDEYERLDKAGKRRAVAPGGPVQVVDRSGASSATAGALEALAKSAGRQPADPRDREVARLRRENSAWSASSTAPAQGHRGPGKLSALLEQLATDSVPNSGGETK